MRLAFTHLLTDLVGLVFPVVLNKIIPHQAPRVELNVRHALLPLQYLPTNQVFTSSSAIKMEKVS